MSTKYSQDFLDKIKQGIEGVLKQGKRSISKEILPQDSCAYRGDDDTACFVGQGIPDDKYSRDLEGTTMASDRVQKAWIGRKLTKKELEIAKQFQGIHDNWSIWLGDLPFPEYFKAKCQKVITKYNLPLTI